MAVPLGSDIIDTALHTHAVAGSVAAMAGAKGEGGAKGALALRAISSKLHHRYWPLCNDFGPVNLSEPFRLDGSARRAPSPVPHLSVRSAPMSSAPMCRRRRCRDGASYTRGRARLQRARPPSIHPSPGAVVADVAVADMRAASLKFEIRGGGWGGGGLQ